MPLRDPTIEDVVLLDHFLDRRKFSEQTGIHYQTLSAKINRHKKSESVRLSKEEKDSIRLYVMDLHDRFSDILTEKDN